MSWDGPRLYSWREKALAGDTLARRLVQGLRVQADKLLEMQPLSVMDKTITPISGNKHDYMSQAPYFWYDSSKPNGLPYLRRDGERNPEIYKIPDHSNLADLGGALQQLLTLLVPDQRHQILRQSRPPSTPLGSSTPPQK
ncbi:alginate lyase family protein [Puia sp. P3]|uniref:alginate lyase family protein n=1 Tax=Puia sp. P3 TaxID=3423952 RepID=UPI003D663FAD